MVRVRGVLFLLMRTLRGGALHLPCLCVLIGLGLGFESEVRLVSVSVATTMFLFLRVRCFIFLYLRDACSGSGWWGTVRVGCICACVESSPSDCSSLSCSDMMPPPGGAVSLADIGGS